MTARGAHLTVAAVVMTLLLALVGVSCDNTARRLDYRVTCRLDTTLANKDSVTLLMLDENYQQLRRLMTVGDSAGTFIMQGQIDGPHAAILWLDNDSTVPFYFVLEPGVTSMTLGAEHWNIDGSPLSQAYQKLVTQTHAIERERMGLWQQYLTHAADSSLSADEKQKLVQRDVMMHDSLQRVLVRAMNRDDAVSVIMRERFVELLDTIHQRQLK